MYRLCFGSKHHVSLGCQIVLFELLHQVFDHTEGLRVPSRLLLWSTGKTTTDNYVSLRICVSDDGCVGWSAHLWRRTFIIRAPICASCTRGLQRSCLVRVSSTAGISSGELGWKYVSSKEAESSLICKTSGLVSVWAMWQKCKVNTDLPHL